MNAVIPMDVSLRESGRSIARRLSSKAFQRGTPETKRWGRSSRERNTVAPLSRPKPTRIQLNSARPAAVVARQRPTGPADDIDK